MTKILTVEGLDNLRNNIKEEKEANPRYISVCCSTACIGSGSLDTVYSLEEELKKQELGGKVGILRTGCHGFCERGPLVVIHPERIFYQRVEPKDASMIVKETIIEGKIVEDLLYDDPATGKKIIHEYDIPFYKKQKRLVFGNNGIIDPTNINDSIRVEGYSALGKVLSGIPQEDVIGIIIKSGLRGRGGAGFLTGRKWEFCRNAKGDTKYIVCNADEGDPGAYMDRSILEGNPHSVLEGMLIGGYAMGASKGFIYIRTEYPLAVERLGQAIRQAKDYGLIGENILDTGFNFDIDIREGSGAFVSGEETSLIHAIEGVAPEPRQRPPFPAESGLWGKPTNINNVETWANVPLIINKGWEWYSNIGTEKSKGTKIFSLVGKINNSGLVEVPMGITLREIIYDIGGGIPGGKKFKAVQTGGPSGGCIPASLIDLPVDYEKLAEVGSIMGSGGMVVMDEDTCMVDIAKYFLTFTNDESCGKCTACREGSEALLEVLTRISEGKGEDGDIDFLKELGEAVKEGSQCGLGQTLPNPVLSTLVHFREEYEAHIYEKRCPALVCKDLISYYILPDKCQGCMICLRKCPVEAISGGKKLVHIIDQNKCVKCGTCLDVCPSRFHAVAKVSGEKIEVPSQPVPVEKPV